MKDKMLQKYKKLVDEAAKSELWICQEAMEKEVVAAIFLHRVDKTHYGGLKSTLMQNMSMGSN